MSLTKQVTSVKPAFRIALPGETTLLAVIAVLFLILHIVAGAAMHNASPMSPATTQEEAKASSYD